VETLYLALLLQLEVAVAELTLAAQETVGVLVAEAEAMETRHILAEVAEAPVLRDLTALELLRAPQGLVLLVKETTEAVEVPTLLALEEMV
jgi:hypothetical protein